MQNEQVVIEHLVALWRAARNVSSGLADGAINDNIVCLRHHVSWRYR